MRVTGRIFDKWNLKEFEGLTGKALKDARATWVQNNKEGVREGYLVHHNYVQGQVRDLVVSMVMHGEEVPTPNQILMCATRDIKLREQANHWIFMMHWDDFLPRLLGETFWGKKHRHNKTISKATIDHTLDGQKCVTESTEAHFVALCESCYKKWLHMGKQKAGNQKEKVVVDRKAKEMESKFIKANQGQSMWGGWTDEGVDYFAKVREQVKAGRDQDHVEALEEECLLRIRKQEKLVDDDGKEPMTMGRNSRKRPRARPSTRWTGPLTLMMSFSVLLAGSLFPNAPRID